MSTDGRESAGFVKSADGTQLRFRWHGRESGPVLVLSHSLGTSARLWEKQLESLGADYRLLLYDHRGHGESGSSPGPWTIEDFGKDALAVIESQALDRRVHFCGVSLGGMVGLWLAQNAPERLERMVVANTSAFTEDPALLRGRLDLLKDGGLEQIAEDVLARWFTEEFREGNQEVMERFRRLLLATPVESYRLTSEAVCALDLRSGQESIRTPLLVITGRQDQATPAAWGEAIAAAVPGAQLASLEAAHLSNVEAAEAFDEAVLAFLGR